MPILPRAILKTVFAIAFLAVLAAAGYGAWYITTPLAVRALPVEVEIPRGAGFRRAYRAMQRHLKTEWDSRNANVPYQTPYDALIMASIIEKETGLASERDLIGGVLVNRLRIGMRLQVDPTIIYGLGTTFDGNLKKIHLLTDGPYNTYTRVGLPPTPIAMPGLPSLHAALQPAKTDAAFYDSRSDVL